MTDLETIKGIFDRATIEYELTAVNLMQDPGTLLTIERGYYDAIELVFDESGQLSGLGCADE